MYSATLFLTSALEGVRGQRHALAAPYPGKDPVHILQEAWFFLVSTCSNIITDSNEVRPYGRDMGHVASVVGKRNVMVFDRKT